MLRVYGCSISYYTGKLETYLRYRGIPYESLATYQHVKRILDGAGALQMPVVELDDGRWLSDSSPILRWLEEQQDAPTIYPADPMLRFVALFLEDYADEYLWRPAMHYRWSYVQDRWNASGAIADDQSATPPGWNRVFRQMYIIRRQLGGFVRGDGVSDATREHVERGYLTALDRMEAILRHRRFLLGDEPTIADFGFMGPMLRHFGQDPTPQEIMRNRASGVYAWVARMWNTRASGTTPMLLDEIDEPLSALLREAAETHLVQLRENARGWARGEKRYAQTIQGVRYPDVPSSRYRVWCLEELQREWAALDDDARARVLRHLPEAEASVLWEELPAPSGYDPERQAPFAKGINVFGTGVPPK